MKEGSSEMTAEEMSEEKKPELSNPAGNSGEAISDTNFGSESVPERSGETICRKENHGATEQTVNDNAEDHDQNFDPTSKFTDKDPLDLVPYIEKYVIVQLERNYSYVGFIHSIDPISHSIILSVPKSDGGYQTTFIPGTSVLHIQETPKDSSIIPPKRKQVLGLASEGVQLRKKKVISWLKENRLPVSEEGENVVLSGVTLIPPYGDKDISTTNPIIALEIKKIIGRMPADYQPK